MSHLSPAPEDFLSGRVYRDLGDVFGVLDLAMSWLRRCATSDSRRLAFVKVFTPLLLERVQAAATNLLMHARTSRIRECVLSPADSVRTLEFAPRPGPVAAVPAAA